MRRIMSLFAAVSQSDPFLRTAAMNFEELIETLSKGSGIAVKTRESNVAGFSLATALHSTLTSCTSHRAASHGRLSDVR
jgi:hypothetical protein